MGDFHYLKPETEALIIRALRALGEPDATDFADALENDTWLGETLVPPEDA
jgi:hypothetical protein